MKIHLIFTPILGAFDTIFNSDSQTFTPDSQVFTFIHFCEIKIRWRFTSYSPQSLEHSTQYSPRIHKHPDDIRWRFTSLWNLFTYFSHCHNTFFFAFRRPFDAYSPFIAKNSLEIHFALHDHSLKIHIWLQHFRQRFDVDSTSNWCRGLRWGGGSRCWLTHA